MIVVVLRSIEVLKIISRNEQTLDVPCVRFRVCWQPPGLGSVLVPYFVNSQVDLSVLFDN